MKATNVILNILLCNRLRHFSGLHEVMPDCIRQKKALISFSSACKAKLHRPPLTKRSYRGMVYLNDSIAKPISTAIPMQIIHTKRSLIALGKFFISLNLTTCYTLESSKSVSLTWPRESCKYSFFSNCFSKREITSLEVARSSAISWWEI